MTPVERPPTTGHRGAWSWLVSDEERARVVAHDREWRAARAAKAAERKQRRQESMRLPYGGSPVVVLVVVTDSLDVEPVVS